MRTIIAGLGLSLLAGVAMAQTVSAPPAPPAPGAAMAPDPARGGRPQPGAPEPAPGDPGSYEGMIVQTPHGTYMVTEPEDARDGPTGSPEASGPMPPDGPHPMGPDGMRPPMAGMPHPHRPPPPSKAARFRLKSGDLELGVTCAEEDTTKACVDAIGTLIDRIGAAQHH